jgi:putative DNA primase/helicase
MTDRTRDMNDGWGSIIRLSKASEKAAAMTDATYAELRETLCAEYGIDKPEDLDADRARLIAENKRRDDLKAKLKQAVKDGASRDQLDAMKAAQRREEENGELVIECFANITPAETKWLWSQKLPLSRLIIFSGNPDCGKSTTTCDLIGRYTTGRDWPDGAKNDVEAGDVLIILGEDDPNEDTLPRLIAAGADVSKVHFLKMVEVGPKLKRRARRLALDTDLDLMREMFKKHPNIRLVVADPITNYFGNCNMNREQEIRTILEPLRELCMECRVTFIALIHFNKRSDVNAIHRVSGSAAMTGVPRAVWAFGPDPEVPGEYLMTSVKGNKAKNKRGLRYGIVSKATIVGEQPSINWLGDSQKTAEDLIARRDPKERQYDKAVGFLRKMFESRQPQLSSYVEQRAEAEGISLSTLNRAKKDLRIESKKKAGLYQMTWPTEAPESGPSAPSEGNAAPQNLPPPNADSVKF